MFTDRHSASVAGALYTSCCMVASRAGSLSVPALARDGGFNRWADALDLVVLYPQVAASAVNPLGCWDWWGYTGAQYATREAVQLNAILALAEALTQPAR